MRYWIDLQGVQFEEDKPIWLQALPLKNYKHPVYGDINVTPERVMRFAANVKNKVRGQDLDIDYDHKAHHGEAAGWITDAEAKLNDPDPKKRGLWVAVNFTKEAAQKLKNKAYRYFSPEFQDTWTHPQTNQTYEDVLFGGALTNRPFLKDILPINLSEVIGEGEPDKGGSVTKQLRTTLGLPETASDEEVQAAVEALKGGNVNPPQNDQTGTTADDAGSVQASEQLKKLAESNPALAVLLAERENDRKRLELLEASNRLSEVTIKLNEINTGKKFAVTPAVLDKVKEFAVTAPKQLGDKVIELVGDIAKDGLVELGERGGTQTLNESAVKTLSDRVDKVMEEKKVDYPTALGEVVEKDPALYKAYEAEIMGS